MLILDGKKVSEFRKNQLRDRISKIASRAPFSPQLVVVLIGLDPASEVYVRNKIKSCGEVGIRSQLKKVPDTVSQADLNALISELVQDPDVDGILVQLPLPAHLNKREILDAIPREKDVDGLSIHSAAAFWRNDAVIWPCTPWGVIQMLEYYQIPIAGKHAVVIGRSEIVGQPMAQLLLKHNATVTIAHSKTKNLGEVTQTGDLVVAAIGRAEFIGREHLKKGAIVIDVGIHRRGADQKLVGDVRTEGLSDWLHALSPVPGGVGPLTISSLLENTVTLALRRRELTP